MVEFILYSEDKKLIDHYLQGKDIMNPCLFVCFFFKIIKEHALGSLPVVQGVVVVYSSTKQNDRICLQMSSQSITLKLRYPDTVHTEW